MGIVIAYIHFRKGCKKSIKEAVEQIFKVPTFKGKSKILIKKKKKDSFNSFKFI